MAMDWKYTFSHTVTGAVTGAGILMLAAAAERQDRESDASVSGSAIGGAFFGALIGGLSSLVTKAVFGKEEPSGIQGVWPENRFSQRTLMYRRLVR
jgi:hypothetical protein